MNNAVKKYAVAGVLVIAIIAYFVFNNKNGAPVAITPTTPSTGTTTTNGGTSSGTYKDGTYTGAVADAFYGNLQVKAIISGGAITDVQFPAYPSDNSESKQVNGMAMPILKQEAIAAQNAQVNIVSGATQTSQAFQQSLADALSQAKS
jgi:uncharacterized protein with FMN-binding domain